MSFVVYMVIKPRLCSQKMVVKELKAAIQNLTLTLILRALLCYVTFVTMSHHKNIITLKNFDLSLLFFVWRLCHEWPDCWFKNNGWQSKGGSTGEAPISTYKFSRLISIHFLKELDERNCSEIKASSLWWSFLKFSQLFLLVVYWYI